MRVSSTSRIIRLLSLLPLSLGGLFVYRVCQFLFEQTEGWTVPPPVSAILFDGAFLVIAGLLIWVAFRSYRTPTAADQLLAVTVALAVFLAGDKVARILIPLPTTPTMSTEAIKAIHVLASGFPALLACYAVSFMTRQSGKTTVEQRVMSRVPLLLFSLMLFGQGSELLDFLTKGVVQGHFGELLVLAIPLIGAVLFYKFGSWVIYKLCEQPSATPMA